jgi:hypothetical protein
MANSASLPAKLQAQLDKAGAKIPIDHRRVPSHNSVVSHPDTAFTHINNWALTAMRTYVPPDLRALIESNISVYSI